VPVQHRGPAAAHRPVAASPSPAGGATSAPRAPIERRELGARTRNAGCDSRFTGNTAFSENFRNRRAEEAINLAGGREAMPKIVREGEE
jgi:hypothetical protein